MLSFLLFFFLPWVMGTRNDGDHVSEPHRPHERTIHYQWTAHPRAQISLTTRRGICNELAKITALWHAELYFLQRRVQKGTGAPTHFEQTYGEVDSHSNSAFTYSKANQKSMPSKLVDW